MNARAAVLGHTPLHLAAQFNDNPAVIEVLLDAGADLKAQDLSGNTPWDYAKDREEFKGSDAYRRLSEAQELAAACEEWDTLGFFISATPAEVQKCLNAGADVNTRDEYGNTPLHWATRYSDISAPITVALIEAGADVNAQDDEGKTPLHEAAARPSGLAIIEALLEAGADATLRDDEGKTPWGHARSGDAYRILGEALGLPAECAEWSTPEFFETATPAEVRACFPARGDANTDGHGLPPLHHAAAYIDNPAIIWALVEAGAEVNARDVLGHTPLAWAAAYNDNPAIIWTLLSAGAEVDARVTTELRALRHEHEDWTPLHLAAQFNDNPAVIQALVDAGAEVDAWASVEHLSWARWTPLHRAAAYSDNPAIITALLYAGADATAIDTEGLTPWDLAQGNEALEGTDAYWRLSEAQELAQEYEGWNTREFFGSTTLEEVIEYLEAGAEVNARDESGKTPLHYAVQRSSSTVAAALIDAGAEVNARGSLGETPLHTAALHNPSPAFVKILVEAGAEVNARGEYGHTPLHYAVRYNSDPPAFAAALINAGADVNARDGDGNTPLHHVPSSFDPEAGQWGTDADGHVIGILLDAGADVSARDDRGETPLYNTNGAAALVLVDAGADVNVRNDRGETPLHLACWSRPDAALVLLVAGADVNARDEDGWTPLYHAVAPFWEEESPTLIGALLAAGAWVNIPGFSPLHRAARDTNTPAVIKVLLAAGADASARDQEGKTPWDYAQDNEALRGTDAWWRLREERFR